MRKKNFRLRIQASLANFIYGNKERYDLWLIQASEAPEASRAPLLALTAPWS
jgi:hypothetical protein